MQCIHAASTATDDVIDYVRRLAAHHAAMAIEAQPLHAKA
jgi:hypothetical protein